MIRVPQESTGFANAPRLRRFRGRRRVPLFGWLMALPAIVVLLAVTVYPLVYSLRKSFYRIELTFSPVPEYVGIRNYVDAIQHDPRFWHAMERSLYLVGVGVTVELVLGLALAHVLNRIGRGRNIATALLLVPAMIAPVAVAIQGVVIFNDRWGPLNYVLKQSGVSHPPAWLADRTFALNTILLADIWQWTPFVALIMPLLQPLIIITVLIRAMDVFKTFDTVYVMTGGGPGDATETASFYTFLQGLRFFSFGYAAAISYISWRSSRSSPRSSSGGCGRGWRRERARRPPRPRLARHRRRAGLLPAACDLDLPDFVQGADRGLPLPTRLLAEGVRKLHALLGDLAWDRRRRARGERDCRLGQHSPVASRRRPDRVQLQSLPRRRAAPGLLGAKRAHVAARRLSDPALPPLSAVAHA